MTHRLLSKRLVLAGIVSAALAAPLSAQELRPRTNVQYSAAIVALEGEERAAALAAANRSLNGVAQLQGRFVQTAPGGARSTGTIYMQRPGKLRFEYDPPASLLIVSDGRVVAMRDTALRTTERTTLNSTPLNLILGANINLERDARITRVSRSGPWTMITARDRRGQVDGYITLNFHGPNAELRSWDVTDVTGSRTRISLSNVTQPASLDRALFRLEDMLESGSRRPR